MPKGIDKKDRQGYNSQGTLYHFYGLSQLCVYDTKISLVSHHDLRHELHKNARSTTFAHSISMVLVALDSLESTKQEERRRDLRAYPILYPVGFYRIQ